VPNLFRELARRPRIEAAADGAAVAIVGTLTSLAAPIIQKYGIFTIAFLSSGPFIGLAISTIAYVILKVGTVRETEFAFDFDKYVEERIAPAYADTIVDAIKRSDTDAIVDLSAAIRKARKRQQ
jgi:hypothetical protein